MEHCSNTELRAPRVPSKSLQTMWGWKRQILNPWVPPSLLGAGDAPLGRQLRRDWDTSGGFPHLLPQPRHIQQLSLPPNPDMGGTSIPGHPWKATKHHISLGKFPPPAWQVPHIHAPLHSPKSALLVVLGWGFFWFAFFFLNFNTMFKVVYCSKVSLFHVIVWYCA